MKKFLNILTVLAVGGLWSTSMAGSGTASVSHEDSDLLSSPNPYDGEDDYSAVRSSDAVSGAIREMKQENKIKLEGNDLSVNTGSLTGDEWFDDKRPQAWKRVGTFKTKSSDLTKADIQAAVNAIDAKKSNARFTLDSGILTGFATLITNGLRNNSSSSKITAGAARPAGSIKDGDRWKITTPRDIAKARLKELLAKLNR